MKAFLMSALRNLAAMLAACFLLAAALGLPGGDQGALLLLAEGFPFILIRPNGRIVMASRSARRLFGLAEDGGGNILSLTAGTPAHDALRRSLRNPFERRECFRACFPGSGGETRLYRMESSPMGEGEGAGIVLRDITRAAGGTPATFEVARMAATARSMAGPLTVLAGWLETAQETAAVLSPPVLRAMGRQVELLKGISAELSAQRPDPSSHLLLGEFDLTRVAQDAADSLAARMLETGSRLEFHYSETPFLLRGDSMLWQQLAGELLGSTLALGGARRLRFSATRSPQHAVIEISSDGPAAWATAQGGGSRLELVRAAVRAQRGEFTCEPTHSDGARYRLTFPV